MAAYNKFQDFAEQLLVRYGFNGTDTFKIYLSNATPSASLDAAKADLAEISAGNGYTAGGNATTCSVSESAGTGKVTGTDPTTWTASGGTIGPFQYAALYNDTSTSPADALIAWWDYGSAVTLQIGETFSVDLDGAAGIFTVA